jgi:hypothetical protein
MASALGDRKFSTFQVQDCDMDFNMLKALITATTAKLYISPECRVKDSPGGVEMGQSSLKWLKMYGYCNYQLLLATIANTCLGLETLDLRTERFNEDMACSLQEMGSLRNLVIDGVDKLEISGDHVMAQLQSVKVTEDLFNSHEAVLVKAFPNAIFDS